jgi:hypothetical protein
MQISTVYQNGYTYLAVCPCCGGKDKLSFHLQFKSVKCWAANCDLNTKTTLHNFAKRYNLVKDFEDYYGVSLHQLGEQHNRITLNTYQSEKIDLEKYWEDYVPFDNLTQSHSLNYLKGRGVSTENIQRFQLGRTKLDNGVIIPFNEYRKHNGRINTVLNYYQIRWTNPTKYMGKYYNPTGVEKPIYNLYSMYNNNIRFGVEGVFDVLTFGDSYFAILGSDFSDRVIESILKYLDYLKENFNTVLKNFEIALIPDIGVKNLEYWQHCLRVLSTHTEIKLTIVNLTEGTNFPKHINDGAAIKNAYANGMDFITERITQRKKILPKFKKYYINELV